ncbi:MAG TPA: L,D-transpeptidase family protein [Candidatus Acidoferrales bacterium]|nr:L,D-transpeptidase family protein [Candidatus Acidoferrales bacterium]
MNRRRIAVPLEQILVVLMMALVGALSIGADGKPFPQQSTPDTPRTAQQLSPDGQASSRAIIDAGNLPGMRWPDFNDHRADLKAFYEAYGYALPWLEEMQPTPQALSMITLLQAADQKGLSADDYDGPRWAERLETLRPTSREPSESDAVRFDMALTVSAMRYISDLHVGRVNPVHLDFAVDVQSRKYDLPEFLIQNIVGAADLSKAVASVEPPYPGYARTIQALQTYMQLARPGNDAELPTTKTAIKPGDSYAATPQLAKFLRLVGDLPPNAPLPESDTLYEGALVDAVKRFQQRHGLSADGRLDARTLAELDIPLSRRVRQMQLTLERWRWLPSEYEHSPIVVNIPEFRLRGYDDHFRIGVTMNVVVGKAYKHKTPVFMSEMRYLIFRPYWDVTTSIAKAEIIPDIEHDSEYMSKQNLEIVDRRGNVVSSGPATSDMMQEVREGKLFIRQKPGPNNSLGLVKFLFPNEYSVYMHDTPATELFSQSRRDFSHGCIRLEKPAQLAAWVLRDNPGWTMEHIEAAMNGDKTVQVNLERPIPVLIVYGTVIVLEDGVVHFYDDIYGHDVALDKALAKGYPYPR